MTAEPQLPGKIPNTPDGKACPRCGTARQRRFCENCGFDLEVSSPPVSGAKPAPFTGRDITLPSIRSPKTAPQADQASLSTPTVRDAPAPPQPETPTQSRGWIAQVDADRAYFEATTGSQESSVSFPPNYPPWQAPLRGQRVRIGRRSASRGLNPEIDLSRPPADPGISHLHAVLLAQPGGGWQLIDPGSTNGTTLNDDPDPLPINAAVPLADGDQIHLGAWTTITVHLTT